MPTKEELNHGFEIGKWEVFPARGEMRCGDQIERPCRFYDDSLMRELDDSGFIDSLYGTVGSDSP